MLVVVQVAADIHVDVVPAQDGVDAFLHVGALRFRFVGRGEDGVVSYHHDPVLVSLAQGLVEPCELCLCVLLTGIGIGVAVVAVFVDQGRGVDEHDAKRGAVLVECPCVVACGHLPAARHI